MFQMPTKGQITIEFMVLISFLFLISIGFFIVAATQMDDFNAARRQVILEDFGDSLHRELSLASGVREGYTREITLPEKIEGVYNYTIIMLNTTLTIEMGNEVHVNTIPPTRGTFQKGKNTLQKMDGTIIIENG